MKITIEGSPEECKALLEKLGKEVVVYNERPFYEWWKCTPVWTTTPYTTSSSGSVTITAE